MDRLFSGLLSSVRKAASRSTSTGTSSDTLRSPSTSQPKRVTYNAWRAEVEPKIDAVGRLLTSLLQRQERLNEFQAQLKKLNSSLLETDALLSIDIYEDGRREMKDNAAFIDILLEHWYKLILLIDKVDMDHGVHYLNSINKVILRPEFDLMHTPVLTQQGGEFLKIAPEQLVVMRRYLTLLFNTHTHIAVKLSESSPIGANSPIVRFQNLHTAYARILAACYFRLPQISGLITEACSLEPFVLEKLWDFTHTFPVAANAGFTGAETVLGPSASGPKGYRSPGNPKMGRSVSAAGMMQSTSQPTLSPPRQRQVVPPAAVASSTSPPGAPAPSPMLSRVRREFSPPSGISAEEPPLKLTKEENLQNSSRANHQAASSEEIAEMEARLLEQRKQLVQKEAELIAHIQNGAETKHVPPAPLENQDEDADSTSISTTRVTVITSTHSVPNSPQPSAAKGDPHSHVTAPSSFLDIPPLFSWCKLHSTLIKSDRSRLSGSWNEAPRRKWLQWFNRGESALFIIFLREWIAHVQSMVERTRITRRQMKLSDSTVDFKWSHVRGFNVLVDTFLFNMRQYERPSKLITDASKSLLTCDPTLINFFIKHIYSKTNLYNMDLVNHMFSKLDIWFSEFDRLERPLPQVFDSAYFCSGLEMLLELDHHQLTSRILAFVFTNSSLMMGEVRKAILYEFFLKKYFFRLFLHWDDVVRNYFHQLLIYRMVRIPRSQLAEAGFHTPEIAVVGGPYQFGRFAQLGSEEDLLDMKLFTNISAYVRTVEDQLRSPNLADPTFDRALEIYAPKALAEYRYYLSRYEENESAPKLIPMHMLQDKKPPAGVKAQPTRAVPRSTADDCPS